MNIFFITSWIRRLSIPHKLYIIAGASTVVLVLQLAGFWFAMTTMSAIRAYVGGEGLWSKSEKEAVASLLRYSSSANESDYITFLVDLQVPLGDERARLELDKPDYDDSVAVQGILDGNNNPADVRSMISLYRNFRHTAYMKNVIDTWAQGDDKIHELRTVGYSMHDILSTVNGTTTLSSPQAAEIKNLSDKALSIDNDLTILEDNFSSILGDVSRKISILLFEMIVISTGLLVLIIYFITSSISKLVTRTDKAKNEFVSLASHQLRTPLTAVSWSSEHLLKNADEPLSANQRELVSQIHESNHRMINLVNTLLSLSTIDLGMIQMKPTSTDVRTLIMDVHKEVRAQCEPKGVTLTEEFDADDHVIWADPEMFRMVIQNIITNAVVYTPKGGSVTVVTKSLDSWKFMNGRRIPSGSLLISVKDTGCGIPKREQAKIFSKLFRAGNAQKTHTDGTGLGLYIAKAVVDAMDGFIWFTSEENKGTTFYVAVPYGKRHLKAIK